MPDPLLCETSSKGGSLYQPRTTAPLETYQFGSQTEHSVDKLSPQIEKSGERKTYECFFVLYFQLLELGAYCSCQEQVEIQV